MACGCKAKKSTSYVDPITSQIKKIQLQPSDSKIQTHLNISNYNSLSEEYSNIKLFRSGKSYLQIRKQLDTSSTTKPDQLCFNCIRKHLAIAYLFSQQSGMYRKFTALGQLLCVVQHLKEKYPNLAYKIRDMVIVNLRQPGLIKVPDLIKQLIIQFQKDPQKDIDQYVPLPVLPQEQELLTILLVQSLLFIQLTYQEVNKTWATAQLSFFSYNDFRSNNSLKHYQVYRPLWKLIQSMQPFDQNYKAARDYIYSLIASKYPYYQQIVLPKMKDQLQQDYAKQKELMQKLQEQKQQTLPQPS